MKNNNINNDQESSMSYSTSIIIFASIHIAFWGKKDLCTDFKEIDRKWQREEKQWERERENLPYAGLLPKWPYQACTKWKLEAQNSTQECPVVAGTLMPWPYFTSKLQVAELEAEQLQLKLAPLCGMLAFTNDSLSCCATPPVHMMFFLQNVCLAS